MVTRMAFSISKLKSHLNYVSIWVLMFLYREMIIIGNFLWVFACNCLLFLLGFLDRYLHRLEADENFVKYDPSCVVEKSEEKDELSKLDRLRKGEKWELFSGSIMPENRQTKEPIILERFSSLPIASKYEINSRKDLSGFVEEPEIIGCTVEEFLLDWNDGFICENGNEENRDFGFPGKYQEKGKVFNVENDKNSINQFSDHSDSFDEYDFVNLEKAISEKNDFGSDLEDTTEDSVESLSEETNLINEENVIISGNDFYGHNEVEKSDSNDFTGEFTFSLMNSKLESCDPIKGDSIMSPKVHLLSYDDEKSTNAGESILDYSKSFDEETNDDFRELGSNLQYSENEGDVKGNTFKDEDDEEEFDVLSQHQKNIEKMKMEMKNSKIKGLPTILENCESLKIGEDLKPLKIDEKKLEHKDRMDEINKVYKSYSEKMRKLDILNYQTLNAISFMQLKDPDQRGLGQKSSSSAMKFLKPSKLKRIHDDPTLKSVFEMHKKLEIVYVAQLCLSWETLRWKHAKAKELVEHDSEGLRSYNLVAGEFQQFQVLVQRFVENEQFLGPRVQNYAKNRCDLRVFFHVPLIKEDCLKEKRENNIEGNNEITILMLSDIIDETIHVFWEFVRTDHNKDGNFSKLKGLSPHHQDRSHSDLFMGTRINLQMKEKRLKDILRTGNCIVKKFQKQPEGRTDLDLLFAQIDLKLVSRVLKVSRLTTDQLIWCQNKLQKVKFNNKKVHVEPSFLLFPI